jgi:hypothetical protein
MGIYKLVPILVKNPPKIKGAIMSVGNKLYHATKNKVFKIDTEAPVRKNGKLGEFKGYYMVKSKSEQRRQKALSKRP